MLTDAHLEEMASALVAVEGVEAVALGGSRTRGTHQPDSDFDLGLYYRLPLDLVGLRLLAGALARGGTGMLRGSASRGTGARGWTAAPGCWSTG